MNFGAGISTDGKKLALIRHPDPIGSTLSIANSDGTNERELGEGHGPEYLGIPAALLCGLLTEDWQRRHPFGKKRSSALRFFTLDGGMPMMFVNS